MKHYITFIFVLSTILSFAQEITPKFDFRFGAGTTLLGSGDMRTTAFENELNYRIHPLLATNVSVNYGRSYRGVSENASYLQGNLNLLFSPFKNNKRYDFRIGTGLSFYNVNDVTLTEVFYENGEIVNEIYEFDRRNALGFNVIIENTFALTDKLLIGLKLFTQPYMNGDINSGVLLKMGIRL